MHKKTAILLGVFIVLLFQVTIHGSVVAPTLDDRVVGPDSFMRLHRVLEWSNGSSWYQNQDPHINAPDGHALHWTRPLDVLLYAGAWLGSAFTDFRTALVFWGLIISPLFLIATIVVWSWATRPFLDDRAFLISVGMLILMPFVLAYDGLGRVDHHSMQLFLFSVQLAIFLRYARDMATVRQVALAGSLCGLALWISMEGLSHLLMFCSVMGVFWLWRGGRQARDLAIFLFSMLCVVTVAMVVERPPGQWLTAQYDRVSIVHFTLLLSGTIGWSLVYLADRSTGFTLNRPKRYMTAAFGCLIPGVVMLALFPAFFAGPFAEVKGEALNRLLSSISEFRPMLPYNGSDAGMFIYGLGPSFLGLAYLCFRWRGAERDERPMIALLLIGMSIFLTLATFQARRWVPYALFVGWLPWTLLAVAVLRGPWTQGFTRMANIARPVALTLAILGPAFVGLPLALTQLKAYAAAAENKKCDWMAAGRYLAQLKQSSQKTILTHFYVGPQIAWLTDMGVVGAPYNVPIAYTDTVDFLKATDDDVALEIAGRRRVDFVLVCPDDVENWIYADEKNNLFARLSRGESPPWLARNDLPDTLSSFRLYRVVR